MERDEAERPSVAWATVSDVSPDDVPAPEARADMSAGLRPAHRRVTDAVAAALAELRPASTRFSVTVGAPYRSELARSRSRLQEQKFTAAEASRRLGLPISESELVGWVSEWSVSARGQETGAETSLWVLPATEAAELRVDIAEWLQTALADEGISDAVPPCPGHPHPMRPEAHEGQAWWACPTNGPVRPWAETAG